MNRAIKITFISIVLTLLSLSAKSQFYSVSTNILGWATASPNVGMDIALNRKVSISIEVMGNYLTLPQFSTQHILSQQGMRFWLMENNIGSFLGFHFTEALYNVGNEKYMFKGWTAGIGASYGYALLLSKRWSLGFEIGASVMYMEDQQTEREPVATNGALNRYNKRVMVLPTKLSISMIYLF